MSKPTTSRSGPRDSPQEIIKKSPDLVGLQEVALWRTGPPSLEPLLGGRAAERDRRSRYDYLELLLDQLNKGKKRYRVAVASDEFDFEAPADVNGLPGDGPNAVIPNAEVNGRLTMRDVILAKVGAVKVSDPTDRALLDTSWSRRSRGSKSRSPVAGPRSTPGSTGGSEIHFVDTHLESFDPANRSAEHPRPQAA